MNASPRRQQTTVRPKSQQPQGNWIVSKGISYGESYEESIGSQVMNSETRGRYSPTKPEKQQRNSSWTYEKSSISRTGTSDARNSSRKDVNNQSSRKNINTGNKKNQMINEYQFDERDSRMQFIEQDQIMMALRPSHSMIAEDIEDESSSPLKPNPFRASKHTTDTALNSNGDWNYISDSSPPKAKIAKTQQQQQQDLNALMSTGVSTGLSGNESTPSSMAQGHFKFPYNIDFLDFDEPLTQPSDLQLHKLASTERLDEEIRMEMELEIGVKSLEEELAEFDPAIDPCGIDSETIEYLAQQEKLYSPDPHYLKSKQPNVNWSMRAVLVDWMLEVSMEFTLKRETLHYALNYVDRFLSNYLGIQKNELQLVGVSALFVAAKNEEIFSFKVGDFAKSCDGAYTPEQITSTEMTMLKTLKWMLTPPTLNTWAQWYMSQWDLYIEKSSYATEHPVFEAFGKDAIIQFKQPSEKSYALYREIMQFIDCMLLEIEHLQYNKRTLVAGLMYIVLGKQYKQFNVKNITEDFQKSSVFLLDKTNAYNDLFADFLGYIFGFQMEELLPSIQYISPFFKLPLNFDMPRAVQVKGNQIIEVNFISPFLN